MEPLDKIPQKEPVCKFPVNSYNRITDILERFKEGTGIDLSKSGDNWTIRVDVRWLQGFIEAVVGPMICTAENSATVNAVAIAAESGSGDVPTTSTTNLRPLDSDSSSGTVEGGSWTRGDVTGQGVTVTEARTHYTNDDDGIYEFVRTLEFDANGKLVSISGETKRKVADVTGESV